MEAINNHIEVYTTYSAEHEKSFANSVDPDEVAHHEPLHLDLHCLLFEFSV